MENIYQVLEPADFQVIINAILAGSKKNSAKSLVIALQGDLGAGKTTFVQELAKYFEVAEVVTSPTFTIMKQYDLCHDDFDKLVHIDAYRLESEAEVKPLGLPDIFQQLRTIVCVEWPEIIPAVVPPEAVWIKIEINKDQSRQVIVRYLVG